MTQDKVYWLPEWWDHPMPAYRWDERVKPLNGCRQNAGRTVGTHNPSAAGAVVSAAEYVDNGGPPGPPPATAAAIQVTDVELDAIKRKRRESRLKRLRK